VLFPSLSPTDIVAVYKGIVSSLKSILWSVVSYRLSPEKQHVGAIEIFTLVFLPP